MKLIPLLFGLGAASIHKIGDDYKINKPEQPHDNALVICFMFLSLSIGSLFKEFSKRTGVPYTPMLFVIGILWGYYSSSLGLIGLCCQFISSIDPEGVLIIFLPVLIYESGFNFDWHIFKRLFIQILFLAFPCVIFLSFFLQFTNKVILGYGDDYYTWESAFMFGSILSCTDTVATLALLKGCGASKKFTSLIEGESLLNDGACMVLFTISYGIIKGASSNFYQITSLFVQLTFGGMILGLLFGIVSVFWIKKIFNDETLVLNITIISCYLVFFVAENVDFGFKISGILALVSLGLFMSAFGRTRISHEADAAIREFWEYVVYASETVIFLLAGIFISLRVLDHESMIGITDLYKLGGLWGCAMIFRFVSILMVMPILKRCGYGLQWREAIVLTYGGLRGAVGITFALIVSKDTTLSNNLRDIILFQMSGMAVLTLMINGTTLSLVVRALGLSNQSLVQEKIFAGFLQRLDEEIEHECRQNNDQKYLKQADWDEVKKLSGKQIFQAKCEEITRKIELKEKKIKEVKMKIVKQDLNQELLDDQEQEEEDEEIDVDLYTEVRRIFLMSLKGIYWDLFTKNQCSPDALILLNQSANLDLDNDQEHMNSWDFMVSQFSERYINSLFYMKDWWIIGRISRNLLFTYIFYIYDVVSSYIEALDILKDNAKNFNFSVALISDMTKEVEDNRRSALNYIFDYLQVSFPEISRELHTKKASFQILEYEASILKATHQSGQLDDPEYYRLKRQIDRKVVILNNMNPSWELPDLFDVLSKHELLGTLPEAAIRKLIADCREESYGKDWHLYKEGERVNEAFIIMRGGGSEYSDTYKIREKRMLGDVTPIYMLAAPSNRYQTSFIADCVVNATFFKVQTLQQMMKQIPAFEEQVWRQSIPILAKIYQDSLKPLSYFSKQQIREVISACVFVKLKKNQTVKLDQGAILLKGILVEARDNIAEDDAEDDESMITNDQEKRQIQPTNDAHEWKREAITLLPPKNETLRAQQNTLLLTIKCWQGLQMMTQGEQSRLRKSSSKHSTQFKH